MSMTTKSLSIIQHINNFLEAYVNAETIDEIDPSILEPIQELCIKIMNAGKQDNLKSLTTLITNSMSNGSNLLEYGGWNKTSNRLSKKQWKHRGFMGGIRSRTQHDGGPLDIFLTIIELYTIFLTMYIMLRLQDVQFYNYLGTQKTQVLPSIFQNVPPKYANMLKELYFYGRLLFIPILYAPTDAHNLCVAVQGAGQTMLRTIMNVMNGPPLPIAQAIMEPQNASDVVPLNKMNVVVNPIVVDGVTDFIYHANDMITDVFAIGSSVPDSSWGRSERIILQKELHQEQIPLPTRPQRQALVARIRNGFTSLMRSTNNRGRNRGGKTRRSNTRKNKR